MIDWSLASERYLMNLLRWHESEEIQEQAYRYLKKRIVTLGRKLLRHEFPALSHDIEFIADHIIEALRKYDPKFRGNSLAYRKTIKIFFERYCYRRLKKYRMEESIEALFGSDEGDENRLIDEALDVTDDAYKTHFASAPQEPEREIAGKETLIVIFRALLEAKPLDIQIMALFIHHGWPTKEIAEFLKPQFPKMEDTAVRARKSRALSKLRSNFLYQLQYGRIEEMEKITEQKIDQLPADVRELANDWRRDYDLID